MEDFSRYVVYPTLDQIADINSRMIEKFGGLFVPPHNFFNEGSLRYVLGTITDPNPVYMSRFEIKKKAARLGYHIISRHTFNDGNKRTAVHMVWEFLTANGIGILLDHSIIELANAMAQNEANLDSFVKWLKTHQESSGTS